MINKTKMNDPSVRAKLIEALVASQDIVLEEFNIQRGTVRADVVSVNNGGVHGYEIKSDLDTLLRLPKQVKYYNQVFTTNTLVVGADHVVHALYLIPDWWGVIVVEYDGSLKLNSIRSPKRNPTTDQQSIAELLRKSELLEILVQCEPNKSFSKMSKMSLVGEMRRSLSKDSLMTGLANALASRLTLMPELSS